MATPCNLHRLWTRGSLSGSTRLPYQPDGLQGLRRIANACARRGISVCQGPGDSEGVVMAPETSAGKPLAKTARTCPLSIHAQTWVTGPLMLSAGGCRSRFLEPFAQDDDPPCA